MFFGRNYRTFNLAIHAWDEPAETLLRLGRNVPLLMPRLGAPVEPDHADRVEPWWREISALEKQPLPSEPEEPAVLGEPID